MAIKQLITCQVCKTDQHVYRKKVCIHPNPTNPLRCSGSGMPVKDIPFTKR